MDWPMASFPMYQYPVEKHRSENSEKDAQSLQEVLLVAVVKVVQRHWKSFVGSCSSCCIFSLIIFIFARFACFNTDFLKPDYKYTNICISLIFLFGVLLWIVLITGILLLFISKYFSNNGKQIFGSPCKISFDISHLFLWHFDIKYPELFQNYKSKETWNDEMYYVKRRVLCDIIWALDVGYKWLLVVET